MAIRALFPTLIYRQSIGGPDGRRFNQDLADECRSLAASDGAGRRWSARHYLGGYTSYGSLGCAAASIRRSGPSPARCTTTSSGAPWS
jgi:hypothetical protein